MADWQRRLDIADEWGKTFDGELTLRDLARVIAKKLKALPDFGDGHLDETKQEIIADFDAIADDPRAYGGDFDVAMNSLYDWADTKMDCEWPGKKACWVGTFR